MFTTGLFYFTLTCAAGATCEQPTADSNRTYRSLRQCEQAAVTAAQITFYGAGLEYTYKCKPVAFKPQRTLPPHKV